MKPDAFIYAVIADQVASRTDTDRVPAALAALDRVPMLLPFERTAGDEIQGLTDDAASVVAAVQALSRLSGWRIGIGAGTVDQPLPASTRSARGPVYLAARAAMTAARHSPADLALALPTGVAGERYREFADDARDAETALWLLRSVLARRSQEGWELMDLLDEGLSNAQAARRLGISPSAVSQRLARAARAEGLRGAQLAVRLLARLQSVATGEVAQA